LSVGGNFGSESVVVSKEGENGGKVGEGRVDRDIVEPIKKKNERGQLSWSDPKGKEGKERKGGKERTKEPLDVARPARELRRGRRGCRT